MKIIPCPLKMETLDAEFVFDKSSGITCSENIIYDDLANFTARAVGFAPVRGGNIRFVKTDGKGSAEAYSLLIEPIGITVEGASDQGLFYGLQTLKQIINEYADKDSCTAKLPCLRINDSPRFVYRGFMLDCCRHFFNVGQIKRCLDACALLKLNTFHWHLTDDQGWRVAIDKYPRLQEIASIRSQTRGDGKPVSGCFSKEDIKEVVEYAATRYITVVPEFDIPGHTRAAIAAYPELWCQQTPIEVATAFGIHKEILCAGREGTYDFVFGVLDELCEMFPSEYIHIGGDEAVKNEWENCCVCQEKIKTEGLKNAEQLQGFFTQRVIDHLKMRDKVAIVWNESLNSAMLDQTAAVQYWSDGRKPQRVIDAVNGGRKIIVSKFSPLYLDYPYGMFSLKSVYNFEPCIKGITENGAKNILGVESPLWTEYVDSFEKLSYQTFPRLIALAETGWTEAVLKDYKRFTACLPNIVSMLEMFGFAVPPLKEATPNFIKGKVKVIKFVRNIFDSETLKRSKDAAKQMKKAKKSNTQTEAADDK